MYTMIWYPHCSTCVKAKKWLDAQGVQVTLRDVIKDTPTARELLQFAQQHEKGLAAFFNTGGVKYREMNMKEKRETMGDAALCELLAADGMLIKRPILITPRGIATGFKEAVWTTLL